MTCLTKESNGFGDKEIRHKIIRKFSEEANLYAAETATPATHAWPQLAERPDQVARLAKSGSSGSFPPRFWDMFLNLQSEWRFFLEVPSRSQCTLTGASSLL